MGSQNLTIRDNKIVQDKLAGATYRVMAKKYGVSKARIGQILTSPEIKDIIEAGTAQIIGLIPLAVDIHQKAMGNYQDNDTLALKAAETILKTGAIIPSNTTNQTINNIYNQQNNIITKDTMELVKQILPGLPKDEPIDVTPKGKEDD